MQVQDTKKRGSTGERFARLAGMGESVFHVGDLANLWGIRNPNTLHTTLSRYVRAGLLHRVHRGLYATKDSGEIHPYLLGIKALHAQAYVSCESVLFDHGVINQPPREITLVSHVSKRFAIGGVHYRSRKMAVARLLDSTGIEMKDGVRIATISRARDDMRYFYPKKYFDDTPR